MAPVVCGHRQRPPMQAEALDERIDVMHDAASDEAWLHGRFTDMLYR